MKAFRNAFQAGKWAPGAVVAIGNFDGLHLGHQKLIRLAAGRAKALATRCMVLTFDPHPREFFNPGSFRPILPPERKLELLEAMGVDAVVFLPFNRTLTCQAPEAFARNVLAGQLKALDVYVGEDFCFGKDREGRVDDLENFGRELGFLVHPVPLMHVDGERVSSSKIRRLLDEGRKAEAERFLGRRL